MAILTLRDVLGWLNDLQGDAVLATLDAARGGPSAPPSPYYAVLGYVEEVRRLLHRAPATQLDLFG